MARVINGFLGDAIGKLGNVVFRKWNSMITVAQYQPMVKNPNSPKQQVQRQKIKNLSLALQPFKDSLIPLNFSNRKGFSTRWAEAIRTNYPLLDETGNISFEEMKLSAGILIPPVILDVIPDPFINQTRINCNLINASATDTGLLRLSAVGKMFTENAFNTENIAKLPFGKSFITYISEPDIEDNAFNFDFSSVWSEGQLFYNMLKSADIDARAYNPNNIINTPSSGVYFSASEKLAEVDFLNKEVLIFPENIHTIITEDAGNYTLKVYINAYQDIPGLLADDIINVSLKILEQSGSEYKGPYVFSAFKGLVQIPLLAGDESKPINIQYYVTDSTEAAKSVPVRIALNHPTEMTYCEMLFKNGFIHPDSIKINSPFTAIWGDLKDFLSVELLSSINFTIHSKNMATGEERQHIINSDNLFFCSKLLRNQYYVIAIKDGTLTVANFTVIGIDNNYILPATVQVATKVIQYNAGADLSTKVR